MFFKICKIRRFCYMKFKPYAAGARIFRLRAKKGMSRQTAGHALFCQNETGNYCPGVGNLPQSVPPFLFYIKISTIIVPHSIIQLQYMVVLVHLQGLEPGTH